MEAPAPPVAERKCKIEEVLATSFIELIEMAPNNPYVRALILSQTGKMPGADLVTFEQIKDWIETTCEKKKVPPSRVRSSGGDGISITVDFSETEYGRCRYNVRRSGSDEFSIAEDDLLDIVQAALDAGDDIDKVIERIGEVICEDAWAACSPDMDNYGDYDYNDHESDESEDCGTDWSTTQVRERVMDFLQNHHPDLAAQL